MELFVLGSYWIHLVSEFTFTNIEGMTVFQSNLVLIGSMVIGFIVNTVLSVKWSRNTFQLLLQCLFLLEDRK